MASACTGLLEDRGNMGPVTSPTASSGAPPPSTATTLPWCTDSTKPERTTWARTGAADRDEVAVVTAESLEPLRERRTAGRPEGRPAVRTCDDER